MPRTDKPKSNSTETAHQNAVIKVIRYMKSHLLEFDIDLSLDELAQQGCYSKSHLIAVFEEVTGTTPHHFLSSLRIEKAKQLLISTSDSVTEIALKVGYNSFGTFSRTFSDYVGYPPSEFRKAPDSLEPCELIAAVNRFIAQNKTPGTVNFIEGNILAPPSIEGVIFIGTFTKGVPQGRPESGTVLLQSDKYRIQRPDTAFHLLAALVPLHVLGGSSLHLLQSEWVASKHIKDLENSNIDLMLRPSCNTDPPLVVSLIGLLT